MEVRLSQDSYTKSNPTKTAKLDSEGEEEEEDTDSVISPRLSDCRLSAVEADNKQSSDDTVNSIKRNNPLIDTVKVRESIISYSSVSSRTSKASSVSPAGKTKELNLKDVNWLLQRFDMGREVSRLPRVTEVFYYL